MHEQTEATPTGGETNLDETTVSERLRPLLIPAIVIGIVALTQALGPTHSLSLLLGLGLAAIAYSFRSLWRDSRQRAAVRDWLSHIDPKLAWLALGVVAIVFGVVPRFTWYDARLLLCGASLALFAAGIYRAHRRVRHSRAALPVASATAPSEYTQPPREIELERQLSQEFREQVGEAVFGHARRASYLNLLVAVAFFTVGIGVFAFLAYVSYAQLFAPSKPQDTFVDKLANFLAFQADKQTVSFDTTAPLVGLYFISRFAPFVGLLFIGWIAGRMILNATRLSQRRVIQDTLAELGPLQATLAGIPPRKPILQVVEQSLQQTRRAFLLRTWLSTILFGVGVALFIVVTIHSIFNGFSASVTTAVAGGAGVVSFILSILTNTQKDLRASLGDITKLEMDVAFAAQRSEIVDLYIARLMKYSSGFNTANELGQILELVETRKPFAASEPDRNTASGLNTEVATGRLTQV